MVLTLGSMACPSHLTYVCVQQNGTNMTFPQLVLRLLSFTERIHKGRAGREKPPRALLQFFGERSLCFTPAIADPIDIGPASSRFKGRTERRL